MTAPCGLPCFNCHYYLANENEEIREAVSKDLELSGVPIETMLCEGCRNQRGILDSHKAFFNNSEACYVYKCTSDKKIDFCYQCSDFPCDLLHPCADRATVVPHNTKVFNLCLIKKMGVESWAKEKAATVLKTYFGKWFSLHPIVMNHPSKFKW